MRHFKASACMSGWLMSLMSPRILSILCQTRAATTGLQAGWGGGAGGGATAEEEEEEEEEDGGLPPGEEG